VPAEDVIPARIVIFCAMAAMFVASLAVPGAFGQYGVLFGSAYFVVQLSQVVLYSLAAGSERRLSAAQGEERARLARDSYSYLHLPMVAGIIFVALGVKQTLSHVGDPLGTISAVALCGGVALYLLGHNAFRLREVGSVSVPRLVVTMLCLALIPLAVLVPSLITLVVLALMLCGLAAFETATSREFRRALRAR
jgi:low temperature requirement protein LtrA